MVRKNLRFRRPEFQEKLARARRFERSMENPRRFWPGVAGAIVLAIFYFLAVSNIFIVEEARIRTDNIAAEDINGVLQRMKSRRLAYVIRSSHILAINKDSLLSAIQQDLPSVRSVKYFRRIFPDKIEIELEEREPRYIWRTGENYYLLDQDGVIFQKLQNYIPETYSQSLITDKTGDSVAVGDDLPVDKALLFIDKIAELWPGRISHVNFASFSVPGLRALDVFVKTSAGFEVYFDLERSAEGQIASLNFVLNQEIKPETYSGLAYIDLRLPTTAYYCYKDAPCAPENIQP